MLGYRYSALVVDDENAVRKLTIRALERHGFVCAEASDGVEASRLLATRNYQVLVTDLRMPNGNGYSLATDQLERAERPLIVILTGVMEPRLAQDLLRRGIDDIMFKPVNYEMFAGKVAGLMERRFECNAKEDKQALANVDPEMNQLAAGRESNTMIDRQGAVHSDTAIADKADRVTEVAAVPRVELKPTAAVSGTQPLGHDHRVEDKPKDPCDSATVHQRGTDRISGTSCRSASSAERMTRWAVIALHRLTGRKLAWFAGAGLLLFSVWLWLQVQMLRQTNRAIGALEQLGARIAIAQNGTASVSFEPNQRPTGLGSLRDIPNLRQVNVAETLANDEDLHTIGTLTDLEDLDLQRTKISDGGLEHLKDLNNLRQLSLRGTQITDGGLGYLKRLRSLRALSLRDTDVSAKGVDELQQAMPHIKIDHSSAAPQGISR